MCRFSSLIEADIDLCNDSVPESIFGREIVPGHLKHPNIQFNNVKTLTVSSSILKALSFAPLDTFAIFQNVTHLKMKAELCNWHLLSYILERSITLQVLIFTKGTYNSKKSRERCWYEPRKVPKCVASSLRLISIHGFQGLNDKIQMMKYFIENAQVLARLEINVAFGARSRLYRKIKKLHKVAMRCEIVFLS
ncbi:hypothetical protein LIER_13708 [Lithospermum erythrorhizon]|uniref:FBD domain-containing protein n=1 Tax=Lithospermum erythrorhizon TaxID=34254 RepID=A0AAV3PYP3_LITER